MNTCVFLGPSCPVREARRILDATYLPPAEMGDVWVAMQRGWTRIVIIDGVFEEARAVWPKEIRYALSQGIRVYGGAGMGAVRAADLHADGMIGVGETFEELRARALVGEDEVAVAHGPAEEGFRPHSEALVNIRATLQFAQFQGVLAPSAHAALIDIAKQLRYPDRTWQAVFAVARMNGVRQVETVSELVMHQRVDRMRQDAHAVLVRVAHDIAREARCSHPVVERPSAGALRRSA